MPYATPTSPIPSPAKENYPYHPHSRKGFHTPPTHVEDADPYAAGPSFATGPMPGIPRRSSSSVSSASASNTPRRGLSPAVSRQPSAASASRPLDGLPRRMSGGVGGGALGVTGLPGGSTDGGLGLSLHPSPTKAPSMERGAQDSMDSTSTIDSSLPPTPADEHAEFSLATPKGTTQSIPFPEYQVPSTATLTPIPAAPRSTLSPARPPLLSSRRSSALGHHRGAGATGSLQMDFATTSASTSSLPLQRAVNVSHLRPTASMIRKKSGEVVKPSLKTRSMSTPDLTRQAPPESEPSTPDTEQDRAFPDERSKSVRFAGADEGESGTLESVVLFLREQKPTAVGKAADPDGHHTETDTDYDASDVSDFVSFRTRRNAAARAQDESQGLVMEAASRVPRVRVDFAPEARGALVGENVVLERAELVSDTGPLMMKGTVIVRNLSFQKWVAVRFTMDHWQTVSEVSGSHVCHVPASTTGDEGWDRFSFVIKLEDYKRNLHDRQMLMCIRFSIDGREWWDSNDGLNYNFTYKKTVPKRQVRSSGPPALGSDYIRYSESSLPSLPGLRQKSNLPSSQINRDFGVVNSTSTGPRSWTFPRLGQYNESGPSRPDSPAPSAPPPAAYKAPTAPDVHSHLSLSKYCAPTPPTSPPKETGGFTISSAETTPTVDERQMNVLGGQYATLAPPPAETGHERRSSWSGQSSDWDSFATAMERFGDETTPQASTDGETTPVAAGSRSPATGRMSSSDSSPDMSRPLALKRSTGDLQALRAAEMLSPPSSSMSSPGSPAMTDLAPLMSPSPSMGSMTFTEDSSPSNTVSGSAQDLSQLAIDEPRGRQMGRGDYKMLYEAHQEFLDKFCFFQSPRMTPNEVDPVYSRPSYLPISGHSSPTGFPFYAAHASNSPRNTPTPTRQYDSAQDAFNFKPANPTYGNSHGQGHAPGTAAIGQGGGNVTTARGAAPAQLGVPGGEGWQKHLHGANSPSPSLGTAN